MPEVRHADLGDQRTGHPAGEKAKVATRAQRIEHRRRDRQYPTGGDTGRTPAAGRRQIADDLLAVARRDLQPLTPGEALDRPSGHRSGGHTGRDADGKTQQHREHRKFNDRHGSTVAMDWYIEPMDPWVSDDVWRQLHPGAGRLSRREAARAWIVIVVAFALVTAGLAVGKSGLITPQMEWGLWSVKSADPPTDTVTLDVEITNRGL